MAPVFSVIVTSLRTSSPPTMKEPASSVPEVYCLQIRVAGSSEVAATEVITFTTTPVV